MKQLVYILSLLILSFSSYGNGACSNIEPISTPKLEYPNYKLPKHVTFEVELSFTINENGKTQEIRILRSASNYKHESFLFEFKTNAISVVKNTLYKMPKSPCKKILSFKYNEEDA